MAKGEIMADVVQCSDCGKPVSRSASKCPHCGRPSPALGDMTKGLIFFAAVVIVIGYVTWKVPGWYKVFGL